MDEDGLGKLHGASTTNGNEPEMGFWETYAAANGSQCEATCLLNISVPPIDGSSEPLEILSQGLNDVLKSRQKEAAHA
jgi:hypothetical protein